MRKPRKTPTVEEVLERMRNSVAARREWVGENFDFEIPPCPKCGRLIACGADKLCSDTACPNKAAIVYPDKGKEEK